MYWDSPFDVTESVTMVVPGYFLRTQSTWCSKPNCVACHTGVCGDALLLEARAHHAVLMQVGSSF